MEITKHGNTKDKEPYRLTCYNCGCEFTADLSDTYTIATPILMVIEGHEIRKFRYCDCPECKNVIMVEEVDIDGNSLNNVSGKTKEDVELNIRLESKTVECGEGEDWTGWCEDDGAAEIIKRRDNNFN